MTEPGHVYFHQCPICGEKATVSGITDHECDPNMPPPQFTGILAMVTAEAVAGAPFAPCPAGCDIPPDIHRHFEREPGDYYQLAEPLECCGREYMRFDEITWLDQCAWCREDGKPLPRVQLVYQARAQRDKRRR